ncbi:MAG: M28 family peptidase [Candidatus Eremiobacteraeota bacterium]|nr:M28 family peptidase [Candidatus Eremiobacteraeota bacterium]
MLNIRLRIAACAIVYVLAGCNASGAPTVPIVSNTSAHVDAAARCGHRVERTPKELEDCIQRASLWRHLSQFQLIADENPDPQGHGNRDIGTSGYRVSVAYVARLMRDAGYGVEIQRYHYHLGKVLGVPHLSTQQNAYAYERDWFVARQSAPGTVTAAAEPPSGSPDGCSRNDFAGFHRGDIALLRRGECGFDAAVSNAAAAGASAAILYTAEGWAYEARLTEPAPIPVAGVVSSTVRDQIFAQYRSGAKPIVRLDIRIAKRSGIDYNVIADSPYGDPNHVVAIDAHLDSIYGAGMLDNASGSTSILEVALNMAKTPTRNRLRYIWFGGEEVGLLGSHYYTTHLKQEQLHKIAFDIDVDVTATPNFDILVAAVKYTPGRRHFPPNVIPESKIGNRYFAEFFKTTNIPARLAWFGAEGTDSLSFSLVGVPNSGILTLQNCCKRPWERGIWGGYLGNYEGKIPSFNGGCVDYPDRWCDNLYNNDPLVLELVSRSVAYVAFELANHHFAW